MDVSEDGYASGSIDLEKLAQIEPKTDEAKAQRVQLGIPFEEPKPAKSQAKADEPKPEHTSSKKE